MKNLYLFIFIIFLSVISYSQAPEKINYQAVVRDANGDIQDKTEWHRCVMFGKSAEMAGDLLKKGQLVFTEGKLQTRNWEDKDGVKRYTTEVVCEMFTMLGRKMDNENNQSSGGFSSPEQKTENKSDDEDLPF